MPRMRTHSTRLKSTSVKATFVVLLMLFNVFLSTLSNSVVYADTGEETAIANVEELAEMSEESENKETEIAVSVNTEPLEEAISENETAEGISEQAIIDVDKEVAAPTEKTEEVTLAAAIVTPATTEVAIDCWARVSAADYLVKFSVESSDDAIFEAGSDQNTTSPARYQELMPESFSAGLNSFELENWDGQPFDWTLNGEVTEFSQSEERCEGQTIREIIDSSDQHTSLSGALDLLSNTPSCGQLIDSLGSDSSDNPLTVFAPTDEAFAALVLSPGIVGNEISQLMANPDELCALIQSHIVVGEIISTDVTAAGNTVYAIENDIDGILVRLVGSKVLADGYATVAPVDHFALNGVVHVTNQVLLPQSTGTITPIVTNKTSPALSGTIGTPATTHNSGRCVVVRIDGVPYVADVNGSSWSIPAGVVMLNPTNPNTLFDVVVRGTQDDGCSAPDVTASQARTSAVSSSPARSGAELLGLTMNRGILSFLQVEQPDEAPEEAGQVLGTTTTPVVAQSSAYTRVAPNTCGKGVCGDVAQADPSTIDSDGDGVVDSEDPAPFDADIDGTEDSANQDEADSTSADSSDENDDSASDNVYWWFLIGGGLTVGYYMYRQRNEA